MRQRSGALQQIIPALRHREPDTARAQRLISRNHPRHSEPRDRKSTRLNSSHDQISYAVFCLKKKNLTESRPPCSSTSNQLPATSTSFTSYLVTSARRRPSRTVLRQNADVTVSPATNASLRHR